MGIRIMQILVVIGLCLQVPLIHLIWQEIYGTVILKSHAFPDAGALSGLGSIFTCVIPAGIGFFMTLTVLVIAWQPSPKTTSAMTWLAWVQALLVILVILGTVLEFLVK